MDGLKDIEAKHLGFQNLNFKIGSDGGLKNHTSKPSDEAYYIIRKCDTNMFGLKMTRFTISKREKDQQSAFLIFQSDNKLNIVL